MHFDTALNLLWLTLSVLALLGTVRAHRLKAGIARSGPERLQGCGVALITAALFPYISATDDVLRIQHMGVLCAHSQAEQSDSPSPAKKSTNDGLIRLYEAMDTPVMGTVRNVTFTPLFVAFTVAPVRIVPGRTVSCQGGRSPPPSFISSLV